MKLKAIFCTALLVGVLAACSSTPTTALPPEGQPAEALSEAETNEAMSDLQGELFRTLLAANGDPSSVALQNFPKDAPGLPELDEGALPRGLYTYDADADVWQRSEDDDLVLAWLYRDVSGSEAEATLALDWDADGETVRAAGPGGETYEVPTAMNVGMVAAEQTVADVDLALGYYNAPECGAADGVAEPTSLAVNGTGSLFNLDDVGFNVLEVDGADAVQTQGTVTSSYGNLTYTWNIRLEGQRERESCFTSGYVPTSGSLALSLGADAGSFGLSVDVERVDERGAVLEDGVLQVNGKTAVTFAGTLDDENGNGLPGENVTVSFAEGNTYTLEEILEKNKALLMMLKR